MEWRKTELLQALTLAGMIGGAAGIAYAFDLHTSGRPHIGWMNCRQARALGIAPMHRGERGYAVWLDADNDGIACERWSR